MPYCRERAVLHNPLISDDLIGHSGCWYETSLHRECRLSFPDHLPNSVSHFEEQTVYETSTLTLEFHLLTNTQLLIST